MKLSVKVQLKPTPEQKELLYKTAGCARFAYNWAKGISDQYYQDTGEIISESDLRKQFTQLKKELLWLNEVPNDATKQAIRDYCRARNNFFKGRARYPKFKRKSDLKDSFYNDPLKIEIEETRVRLSVIGWIDLCEHGRLPNYKYLSTTGKIVIGNPISNPRITFDGDNWYLSISTEVDKNKIKPIKGKRIGVDLGLKDFAVTCSKERINKKKIKYSYTTYLSNKEDFKKLSKKKKKLDRKISKRNEEYKKKGGESVTKSNNYYKLLKKRRRLTRKMTNIQKDLIFQVVSELVKAKPETIIIEDLNVQGLMKNRHLAKWVSFNMFYEFKRVLTYKCEFHGIELIVADRFYPSTQTCSSCGYRREGHDKLRLSDRLYTCPSCGMEKDRDLNAAKNLCNYRVA